jgi:hypothetical protein
MSKKTKEESMWCEYSDLPSPLAYAKCADYDSMGNHGRFPKSKAKTKKKKVIRLKKYVQKVMLWVSYRFPKRGKKSIWDL